MSPTPKPSFPSQTHQVSPLKGLLSLLRKLSYQEWQQMVVFVTYSSLSRTVIGSVCFVLITKRYFGSVLCRFRLRASLWASFLSMTSNKHHFTFYTTAWSALHHGGLEIASYISTFSIILVLTSIFLSECKKAIVFVEVFHFFSFLEWNFPLAMTNHLPTRESIHKYQSHSKNIEHCWTFMTFLPSSTGRSIINDFSATLRITFANTDFSVRVASNKS